MGETVRGPITPRFIDSWEEFQRWYGGYIASSFLPHTVESFFANGGRRCYVSRITGAGAVYAKISRYGRLNVIAIGPGNWGNEIRVTIEQVSSSTASGTVSTEREEETKRWRKITIAYQDVYEVYDNVTLRKNAANNIAETINAASYLVRIWMEDGINDDGELPLEKISLSGGLDAPGVPTVEDFLGTTNVLAVPGSTGTTHAPVRLLGRGSGLGGLELIEKVSLLVIPDQAKRELYDKVTPLVMDHCEKMPNRFGIISSKAGESGADAICPPRNTRNAALYFPWIKVDDPLTEDVITIPPAGAVAGIFARNDIEQGVHKAPVNEPVRGALDLEFPVTDVVRDALNLRGVNCISDFRADGRGLRLSGVRTMSRDPEWRYINVRRFFLFVEQSIQQGTRWVVFEPNEEPTWARVRESVGNFMTTLWRNGALMGSTPDEAFFVTCDRTTMTEDDIDNGRLICFIGLAPLKPAEFVTFRIHRNTRDTVR